MSMRLIAWIGWIVRCTPAVLIMALIVVIIMMLMPMSISPIPKLRSIQRRRYIRRRDLNWIRQRNRKDRRRGRLCVSWGRWRGYRALSRGQVIS